MKYGLKAGSRTTYHANTETRHQHDQEANAASKRFGLPQHMGYPRRRASGIPFPSKIAMTKQQSRRSTTCESAPSRVAAAPYATIGSAVDTKAAPDGQDTAVQRVRPLTKKQVDVGGRQPSVRRKNNRHHRKDHQAPSLRLRLRRQKEIALENARIDRRLRDISAAAPGKQSLGQRALGSESRRQSSEQDCKQDRLFELEIKCEFWSVK